MTTLPRLADRITAIAGSVDFSGFTPFFSPLMFFFDKNPWSTLALVVPLAAILLTTLVWSAGDGMHDPSAIRSNDLYCHVVNLIAEGVATRAVAAQLHLRPHAAPGPLALTHRVLNISHRGDGCPLRVRRP